MAAEIIQVKAGDFSRKSMNGITQEIRKAKSLYEDVEYKISYSRYQFPDDSTGSHLLFSGAHGKLVDSPVFDTDQIEELAKYLTEAPTALLEIDESQKHMLTGSFWDRMKKVLTIVGGIGSIIPGGKTISKIFRTVGEATVGSWFDTKAIVTGRSNLEEYYEEYYQSIADEYEWQKDVTAEEIQSAIDDGKPDLSKIRENLDQVYKEHEYEYIIKKTLDEAIANDNGSVGGNKYWDWYEGKDGNRTGDYCALFCTYYLDKAGITIPRDESTWQQTLPCAQRDYFQSQGCYHPKSSDYTPRTGDVVFINWNGGSEPTHAAIIYVKDNGEIWLINPNGEGDEVSFYNITDPNTGDIDASHQSVIVGYGDSKQLYQQQHP